MRRLAHLALTSSLAALGLVAIPGAASAVTVPGPNGKIVFASGRASAGIPNPDAADADSRIWVADYPGGTPVQVTTQPAGTQHRHPNWSPDHSKIAYAAGPAFTGEYAIWIADLKTGNQTEFVPRVAGVKQDRPSWSPDGTKIAYGSGGDIWVKSIAPGATPQQVTSSSDFDERPVWSPDGNTIYFNRGLVPPGTRDIWSKSPVDINGTESPVSVNSDAAADDWQPSISPDGKRICFLRGQQNNTADIYVGNVDGSDIHAFANTAGTGELNCVWAPDNSRILYTFGIFGAGDLQTRDFFGNVDSLSGMSVPSHFDGNADWATNFPPTCPNRTVSIGVNQFTTVQLNCTDPDFSIGAGPPTPTTIDSVFMDVGKPAKGNLGNLSDARKVIYTPPAGFKGTDTFTYTGSDGVTTSAPGTITIRVGTNPNGTIDNRAPKFSSVRLSAKRWRRGPRLPTIAKTKVGTTISFKLDEAGQVTVGFQRARSGRRVGRKCVKPTPRNGSRRACKRFVNAGSLPAFAGRVGLNRVRFQGRLSRSRRLGLGTYRVVLRVVDSAANRRTQTGPTFKIVAR